MNNTARYPRRSCPTSNCGRGTSDSLNTKCGVKNRQSSIPSTDNCLCDSRPISLAMAYVMDQPFGGLYEPCAAIKNGTLFSSLNMPYCAGGVRR